MSDTQRDREERQHVIEVLQNMVDWMQEIDDIATPERIHALFYAIASIKTDLRYDLLYEETSGQADKPTTKNEAKYCDRNICLKNEYNNVGCEDCEVTKSQEPTTKNDLGVDKTFYEQIVEYCNEHFLVLVEKDVWEDARKALTTKNDLGVDAISRQKAIDTIRQLYLDLASQKAVIDILKVLPSVTSIRPKGHWIVQPSNKEQGERDFIWWKCSECGQIIFSETEHDRLEFHAFCGRCGANMREVEE